MATISPLASSSPDGLEKVAWDNGFINVARGAPFDIIAGYVFPGIENGALATILAGWLGTLVVFGVAYGLAWLIISRRKTAPGDRTK
jgi:hypothetical protein